jgi:hypothetical protein
MGRFAIGILTLIAELELEGIKENWTTAVTRAVERGIHISRYTPTGYQRNDDGGSGAAQYRPGRGRLRRSSRGPVVHDLLVLSTDDRGNGGYPEELARFERLGNEVRQTLREGPPRSGRSRG